MRHKYAWDKFKAVVPIDKAIKGNKYFLCNTEIPLIVRDGDINEKHYSLKPKGGAFINGHSSGESVDHYNAKWKIKNDGYFIYKNVKVLPNRIEVEHDLGNGLKPDIVFYDENNSLLCVIEIFKTNRKSGDTLEKLKELNTTVYEYNLNNHETELLCWSSDSEKDRELLEASYGKSTDRSKKEIQKEISRVERDADGLRNSISKIKGDLQREEQILEQLRTRYKYRIKQLRETDQIKGLEQDLERTRTDIWRHEKAIQSTTREIKRIEESNEKERIEYLRKQIREVEGAISWNRNRSKQSGTICARGF